MTKMVAGHGESNQAELHGFPAKKNTKPGLAVWIYQVLWQSFQQNLELRWGWGKFTTRKVYWRRKQLPSKNRGTNTYFQDELDVICQREFDVGGPGRIHWVAWNSQNVPQSSAEGFPARSSKGRKVIQTTEFLKQTVNASDTRILNDLMYLIGTPHMFVCVGVDLMCPRHYIRYSNKFWHVSPKILGIMFGYFWMTGSFLMFFLFTCLSSQFHNLRLQASNSDPPGRFPVVWGCYSRLCEREQAEQKWCEWGIVRLYLYIYNIDRHIWLDFIGISPDLTASGIT